MKYDPLIEHNMRNNFFEKSYIKCGGETISSSFSKESKLSISLNHSFSKESKLSISLNQQLNVLYSLFLLCANLRLSKYIETKLNPTCFYLIRSFFKGQNKLWNQFSWLISCMKFEGKHLSCFLLLPDQTSLPDCLYFLRYGPKCVL